MSENSETLLLTILITVISSRPIRKAMISDDHRCRLAIPFVNRTVFSTDRYGIYRIAAIYGIRKNDQAALLKNTIVEVGTISTAAKAAISALKAIPGLNIGASVINSVIAGGIVAALGEGSIYVFEQIYLGNRDISDVDWVKKIMESQLAGSFIEKIKGVLENVQNNADVKDIAKQIYDLFTKSITRH